MAAEISWTKNLMIMEKCYIQMTKHEPYRKSLLYVPKNDIRNY